MSSMSVMRESVYSGPAMLALTPGPLPVPPNVLHNEGSLLPGIYGGDVPPRSPFGGGGDTCDDDAWTINNKIKNLSNALDQAAQPGRDGLINLTQNQLSQFNEELYKINEEIKEWNKKCLPYNSNMDYKSPRHQASDNMLQGYNELYLRILNIARTIPRTI
jgi:hypothetical protein